MATRNYVPRANGEGSIGTEKKHWGAVFAEKLAVKTLEVIGGGAENDAQPATVGWVKQGFSKLLSSGLTAAGLTCNIAANGYIKLGRLFGGLIIQWGESTVPINSFVLTKNQKIGMEKITFPITFPNYVFTVVNNATAVHTQDRWVINNAGAQNIEREYFMSHIIIPQDVVFIDNSKNEWGVRGSYIAIGY